jgi:hypothetical protein
MSLFGSVNMPGVTSNPYYKRVKKFPANMTKTGTYLLPY